LEEEETFMIGEWVKGGRREGGEDYDVEPLSPL
jgi:hypothetical protein